MKNLNKCAIVLIFFFIALFADDAIILQNGHKGYDGCEDTYVVDMVDFKFHKEPELEFRYDG